MELDNKLVGVVEYEMYLLKKRSIEDFCIDFFRSYWKNEYDKPLVKICREFSKEKKVLKISREIAKELKLSNFKFWFKGLTRELLGTHDIEVKYVISLPIFSMELHCCLEKEFWYSSSLLISVLPYTLHAVDFDPEIFNHFSQTDCTMKSLTIAIPALLLFYMLYKI